MRVPFTKENAGEMARRATVARLARIKRDKEEAFAERERRARMPIDASEDAKKLRVQKQIETCDRMLDECCDPELFVKLTMAKERLWNLIYPKPGSLRPKQSRQDRAPISPIEPLPIETTPTLVAPAADKNHNVENL